jgi:hypothetical protein
MLGTEFPPSNDPNTHLHKTNQHTITRYPSADTQKEIYRDDEARTITLHAKRTNIPRYTTILDFARDDPPARSESAWALNSTFSGSGSLSTSLKRFLQSTRSQKDKPDSLQDFSVGARFGPQSNTVEPFPCIHDDAHDFIISFLLKCLANRRKHLPSAHPTETYGIKPQFVNPCIPFELITPLAAFLVCVVLPFGTHPFFEKRIIRFERDLGCLGDVVEDSTSVTGSDDVTPKIPPHCQR